MLPNPAHAIYLFLYRVVFYIYQNVWAGISSLDITIASLATWARKLWILLISWAFFFLARLLLEASC
jgi:hypothetical protein